MPQNASQTEHSERLSWGVIELQVTNLARAVDFWTQALGLRLRLQDSKKAELGTFKNTLIILHAGATSPVKAGHLGMYHVAIGMPSQAEFSRILARLLTRGVSVAPTDHLASKSIYLSDPDGLEIEVIYETPERFGRFGDLSKGLVMYDVHGKPHSGRAPLDVYADLEHASSADLEAPISDEAFVAHMHFKVGSLDAASTWFEGVGFTKGLNIPNFGFADMGAGGGSSHRLAMNIWSGPNSQPAPPQMAGLTRYTVFIHHPEVIATIQNLRPTETGFTGTDPTGTQINLVATY